MKNHSTSDRSIGRAILLTSAALAATTFVPAIAAAQAAPAPITGTRIPTATNVPEEEDIFIFGSITDPKAAKPADNPADAKLPALPVVYDDEAPTEQPSR